MSYLSGLGNRPEIELRHLWYFVSVAEHGSFTRAAQSVRIAQPPLSRQVQRLERTLGCKLFERGAGNARLTPAGKALLAEARHALAQAERAVRSSRDAAAGHVESLVVGFAASTFFGPFAAAVTTFHRQFPSIRLLLQEMASGQQADALRSRSLDVAVGRESIPPADLVGEEVARERFVAAVSSSHPGAGRESISLSELGADPFVLFPRVVAPELHARIAALFSAAGIAPVVAQEAHDWRTIVALVSAGLGTTIVPESFRALAMPNVSYVTLDEPGETTIVAMRRRERPSSAARDLIAVLRGGG